MAVAIGETIVAAVPFERREVTEAREKLLRAARGHVDLAVDVAPILALVDQNCDFEADILPTVARMVPELPRPLKNWGAQWLVREILAARDRRLFPSLALRTPLADEDCAGPNTPGIAPEEAVANILLGVERQDFRPASEIVPPARLSATNSSAATARASSNGTRRGSALVKEGKDRRDVGASSICH
jgi:hypothetical protein